MAWVGHVGVYLRGLVSYFGCTCAVAAKRKGRETYATMSAIGTATLFGGLVHLDVLHNEISRVKALGVGVCFCIF